VVQSFAALFQFFGSSRLLKDVTHTVLTVTKIIRREMLTRLASETILGDVEPARHILRMLAWLITHEPLMSPFTAKSKLFDFAQTLFGRTLRLRRPRPEGPKYISPFQGYRGLLIMETRGDGLRFASRLPGFHISAPSALKRRNYELVGISRDVLDADHGTSRAHPRDDHDDQISDPDYLAVYHACRS
jgi:hypothetical protein